MSGWSGKRQNSDQIYLGGTAGHVNPSADEGNKTDQIGKME